MTFPLWFIWGFGSAVFWAITPIFRKQVSTLRILTAQASVYWQSIGSFLIAAVFANFIGTTQAANYDFRTLLPSISWAALAGACSVLGVICQSKGLEYGDATQVAAVANFNLAITFFVEVASGKINFDLRKVAGVAFMILGIRLLKN